MKFAGLRNVLRKFDENNWEGEYKVKNWSIANGGYDKWFELYYNGTPVAECIDGVVTSNFGLPPEDKARIIETILEVYDWLKADKKNEEV